MSSNEPLVSVVIPTHDGQEFVAEAVESVLAQDHRPLEVLVCDDGSSDRTVEILGSFGERIRLFVQSHQGASAARNRAARGARGALLAFLDQVEEHLFTTETRFRRRLRWDTYGHYPEHTRQVLDWREVRGL